MTKKHRPFWHFEFFPSRRSETKTWLLSGWKISTDETSEISATSSPTQDRPTFSRSELGAVLDTMNITQAYKNVNPQIKSTDNRGTYDIDTGNIYLQDRQAGKE